MADNNFDQVLTSLNNSSVQRTNPALYQAIKSFITAAKAANKATGESISSLNITINGGGGSTPGLLNLTFITSGDESATLVNSRELLAGSNITFNDSVANKRTISASSGAGSTATYLTTADEHTTLPNSRELLAGTNVTFDDSVPNVRTINVTISIVDDLIDDLLFLGA